MIWRKLFLYLSLTSVLCAQTVTSSLNGVILDPNAAVVPGALCKLTNQETGASLKATAEADGLFTFPTVGAGTYKLEVQATGFKSLVITNISITASERHALGNLA